MSDNDAELPGDGTTGHAAAGGRAADEVRSLDPRSLRGLAHPLRIRLLGALREYGPATASQLAARLGESSGATSYHLRQLAAHDFVVEDPERGTGRERWWKSAHRGTRSDRLEEFMHHADPAVRGAMDLFMHEIATIHAQELGTWLGTMRDWAEEWRANWELSDYTVRLTPGLAREMTAELNDVVERYRVRDLPQDAAGSAPFRVHLHGFPRAEDEPAEQRGPGAAPCPAED